MADDEAEARKGKRAGSEVAVACIQSFPRLLLIVLITAFLYVNKDAVKNFLGRTSGFSFAGFSVTADLGKLREQAAKNPGDASQFEAVPNRLAILWARASQACYSGAQILWVDDHPGWNAGYIRVIQGYGARVMTAESNADAQKLLDARTFDVVISDIARDDPKDQNGLALIGEIQKRWPVDAPPLIFFVAHVTGPPPTGSFALTSKSDELIFKLTDALAGRPGRC